MKYQRVTVRKTGATHDYTRLHQDKLDVKLRKKLGEFAKVNDGWYEIPNDLATHYMCFLAQEIAKRNGLDVVSDDSGAWTSAIYQRYTGNIHIDFWDGKNISTLLATLCFPEIIPADLASLPVKTILDIRRIHADERVRFMDMIKNIYGKLSTIEDPFFVKQFIEDEKKNIQKAIEEYQQSLRSAGIRNLRGKIGALIPIVANAFPLLSGENAFTKMTALPFAGAVLGAVCAWPASYDKEKIKDPKSIAYLMSLQRSWANIRENCDYNYGLFRHMEEFIND